MMMTIILIIVTIIAIVRMTFPWLSLGIPLDLAMMEKMKKKKRAADWTS